MENISQITSVSHSPVFNEFKVSKNKANNVNLQNNLESDKFVSNKKETTKKKVVIGLSILAGAVAIATGAALLVKHGKVNKINGQEAKDSIKNITNNASDIANDINLKKFTDSSGKLVNDINLKKGMAIASDGSMFTGVMETYTKQGKISISYKDGLMTESRINDNLKKTYEKLTEINGDKVNGKLIKTYDRKAYPVCHLYDDKGKIFKKVLDCGGSFGVTEYSSSGKKIATYNLNSDGKLITDYASRIYNEDGTLRKIIQFGDEITYMPDGTELQLEGGYYSSKRGLNYIGPTDMLSSMKMNSPIAIEMKKNRIPFICATPTLNSQEIIVADNDLGYNIKMFSDGILDDKKTSGGFKLTLNEFRNKNKADRILNIAESKIYTGDDANGFGKAKDELLHALDAAEKGLQLAEEYNLGNFSKEDLINGFEKYIKQLKEYASQ